ncbi:MAG: hypothetical protein ACE5G8_13020, partial [Anaerolineae bacterium]
MRIRKRRLKKTAFKTRDVRPPAEPRPVPAAGEPQQIPPSPPKEPDWATVPFKSPKAAKAYQKLLAFCRDHYPCAAILHPETGLPHYLQGELEDQWQESPAETALSFLRENELMLAGLSRGGKLVRRQGHGAERLAH